MELLELVHDRERPGEPLALERLDLEFQVYVVAGFVLVL